MIPEIGQLSLLLALAAALLQCTLPLLGAARERDDWMSIARPATQISVLFIAIAFACLGSCFVRNDFSVLYVAANSNSHLPLAYRVAGIWGGHEGSLLLWLMMLGIWMLAVSHRSRHLPDAFTCRVLGVMGIVSVGFLLFMLTTSNPFERLSPVPFDGNDLNPLLQDPGMVAHPPMLYMGYVGFSVAFAFAMAALLEGRLDSTWARWTRPWTIAAWTFLTCGIMLGSIWAYYVLGWGGWWFWDPVENASFLPWLAGTALIHSLAVTEKRGAFKSWTVLLAIVAFSLSLLGTFLVRSGVLSSVHAFATDPRRGLFILVLLGIVIGGSLLIYAWRAPKVGLGARFETFSRETLLLGNNVVLIVAMLSVLLGTLYPLMLDALGLGKISVGPPYFDTVFVPLMAPVVFLMGVGPMVRWREDAALSVAKRLRVAAVVAVLAALSTAWLAGRITLGATLGLLMTFWIVASVCADLLERARDSDGRLAGGFTRLRLLPRAMVGMSLAHLGIAAFAFGVSMVKSYEVERDVNMNVGDTTELSGYLFRFDGVVDMQGANYDGVRGSMDISREGRHVATLRPEKRLYRVQGTPMTEAAIDPGPTRDLYVSLGEPVDDGAWTVRVYYKPFIDWIWGGCLLMAAGGVLAASDRRYRSRKTQAQARASDPMVRGRPHALTEVVKDMARQVERLKDLHAAGILDATRFAELKTAAEAKALAAIADGPAGDGTLRPPSSTTRRLLAGMVIFALLVVCAGYAIVGSPNLLSAGPDHSAAGGPANVSGTVTLAGALQSSASPDDTVFVYARGPEAQRMPLAVLRKKVRDLPLHFTFDDSMAMSPEARLSSAERVVVTARISRNGDATRQPGDLEGVGLEVSVGAQDVAIEINRPVQR